LFLWWWGKYVCFCLFCFVLFVVVQQSGRREDILEKHICPFLKPSDFLFVCFLFFWDRVSLYSPGCPGTHFVDQAGLEFRNPPASASRVLGLKACATIARQSQGLLFIYLKPCGSWWAPSFLSYTNQLWASGLLSLSFEAFFKFTSLRLLSF
jgi:hypothetical protein